MRSAERWAGVVGWLAASAMFLPEASAQDGGPLRDGGPPAVASAREESVVDDEELPAGHPAVNAGDPHAHPGSGQGIPGVFQPPEDTEQPDPTLHPGSIAVDLRDADDRPVANETVTLGILINSVAKGDSRKHQQLTTGEDGRAVFAGLDTSSSNTAYRVSAGYQGGLFAAAPFQLQQVQAMRVTLHVYQVTHDLRTARVVCEATVAAELKEDRLQVEEALNIYNLGRTAWQPDDVRMALPEGFTAFGAQTTMSDQGVDQVGGQGKLRGTFPPGSHSVEFRYQVPWSGDRDLAFETGVPPHVAIARVMMPATAEITLEAAGFPPPETRRDNQGQTFLVAERRMRPEDPLLQKVVVSLHGLPAPGPGRLFGTVLAACGVLLGLVFAVGRWPDGTGNAGDAKTTRERLLEELADLERAHLSGDVGPKTYDRVRRDLLDAIARTLLKQ